MNKEQPETLRLADALEAINEHNADSLLALNVIRQAGPELRRLHAENEALRAQIGQGVPDGWREFVQRVADQKPEKPDYWSACGQCERNISDAEDLIASAPQAPQQKPIGWLYDWTHSSALGKPDEHFTSFTTDEEHARKHSNARPVFEAAHNIGEKK